MQNANKNGGENCPATNAPVKIKNSTLTISDVFMFFWKMLLLIWGIIFLVGDAFQHTHKVEEKKSQSYLGYLTQLLKNIWSIPKPPQLSLLPYSVNLYRSPLGNFLSTTTYPQDQLLPSYVIGPVTCLKKVVVSIDCSRIQVKESTEHFRKFISWRKSVLGLNEKDDRFMQYITVYNALCDFMKMIPQLFGPPYILVSILDMRELSVFMDMCFRDFSNQSQHNSLVSIDFSSIVDNLPALSPCVMPKKYPLHLLPATAYTESDDQKNKGVARFLNMLLERGKPSGLDPEEFRAIAKKTDCGDCKNPVFDSPIKAELIINPFSRDRALFHLEQKLRHGSTWQPEKKVLNHIKKLDVFNPGSPFVMMQRFIMYFEENLKRLAGRQATILGNFKPITHPDMYPLPLFKDSDGNLLAFLWHGTKVANMGNICNAGFMKFYFKRGSFGKGIYFAIQPCKTIKFTDGGEHCLLLCAVFLGKRPDFSSTFKKDMIKDATSKIVLSQYGDNTHQSHHEFLVSEEAAIVPLARVIYAEPKYLSPSREYQPLEACPVM